MVSRRVCQIVDEVSTGPAEQILERLCEATILALPVDGAGMALMTPAGHAGLLAASDARAAAMENLQHTLGEGPCLHASSVGRPVLLPDLTASDSSQWPGFTSAALEAGIAAVFAFPLQVGAIRLGVLDLYRTTVGSLDQLHLGEALDFATAATAIVLDLQHSASDGDLHPLLADAADGHREIHQATGMVTVQAAVGLAEALLLLRARAYVTGRSLVDIAADVLDGHVTFYPEPDCRE